MTLAVSIFWLTVAAVLVIGAIFAGLFLPDLPHH